jgi:hypothetical protein
MIDEPKIVRTEAQPAAVIHVTVARDKIGEVMGPGLKELRDTLTAQRIEPTGPWFTHHLTLDPSQWDFEIGLPMAAPITILHVSKEVRDAALKFPMAEGMAAGYDKLDELLLHSVET